MGNELQVYGNREGRIMKVKMLDELQMKNIGIPSNLHRDNGRSLMVINLWVKKQEKVGDVVPQ